MAENTTTLPVETDEVVEVAEFVIADQFTEESYSPYALHKVVNKCLEGVGLAKRIPPQMMYVYTSKGDKSTIKIEGTGSGRRVLKEDALAWTEKYVTAQLAKA